MNQIEEDDFNIAFLTLLQKKVIKVKIKGEWITGAEALKHTYKELILDNPLYSKNDA